MAKKLDKYISIAKGDKPTKKPRRRIKTRPGGEEVDNDEDELDDGGFTDDISIFYISLYRLVINQIFRFTTENHPMAQNDSNL